MCGEVKANSGVEMRERVDGRRGRVRKITVAVCRTWVKGTREGILVEEELDEEEGVPFLRSDIMTFILRAVQRLAIL